MADRDLMAFIQARMNSSRYPGKSLAPLNNKPIIDRVIERVSMVVPDDNIVILTTTDHAEDPLVSYLAERGIQYYRGHPTDVFSRFSEALSDYPCNKFFRICGDSPFLEPTLFQYSIEQYEEGDYDIVTNVLSRDFPPGKSVELLNSDTFASVEPEMLTHDEREHVTKYFYDNADEFSIFDISCPVNSYEQNTYAVDTLNDLKALEELLKEDKLHEEQFEVM